MYIKGEINKTVIGSDFNILLTLMDRPARQKINKEIAALSDTWNQMDLIDIFRAFYLKAAEYTHFSSVRTQKNSQ